MSAGHDVQTARSASAGGPGREAAALDAARVARIRADFPVLAERVHGHALVYLDNAATTQKPRAVLDAMAHYYEHENANVHRGVHWLSLKATESYEGAREKVRRFVGARETREIVFCRGTTEAINLVAQTWGKKHVAQGDEIVLTGLEHHSNIVPWQLLCEQTGARLVVVPFDDTGAVSLEAFEAALSPRTRLCTFAHVSNALGTVLPVAAMIKAAHGRGITVLVDGAQAAPHLPLDVQALDADFYAFSAHKMYGPTGVGVLYGRAEILSEMPPWQGGGDMIRSVTFERTTYADIPMRFEAGTPNIAGVVGLGAAVEYMEGVGRAAVAAYELELLAHADRALATVPGLRAIGTAPERAGAASFLLEGIHPHDVGTILDREGIAVRTGHHCAQPVMDRFGVAATTRASFAMYNTREEIDVLVAGLNRVRELLG